MTPQLVHCMILGRFKPQCYVHTRLSFEFDGVALRILHDKANASDAAHVASLDQAEVVA